MKKINIILILIASVCSIIFAFINDKNLVFILKDISVILSISALYIIQKIFKIRINDGLNFIYIVFIFMAHFLGVVIDLYSKIYWYDKLMHFSSGLLTSFAAIYILTKFKQKNLFFNILFIVSFSMLIASIWEVFEYLSSCYFNVDPQKVILTGVSDTMGDIIVALLGSMLVTTSYFFERKYNYNLVVSNFERLY